MRKLASLSPAAAPFNRSAFRAALLNLKFEALAGLGERFNTIARLLGRVVEDDQAAITPDESVSLERNTSSYRRLREIEAALNRLEEGGFGGCAECGEPIAVVRLAAVPYACYCIRCQEEQARVEPEPAVAFKAQMA